MKPLVLPLVSRLLAKAEQRQREIDHGEVRNPAELARREGLSHVYVGHLLGLLRLHPEIGAAIAALPPGTSRRVISERELLRRAAPWPGAGHDVTGDGEAVGNGWEMVPGGC